MELECKYNDAQSMLNMLCDESKQINKQSSGNKTHNSDKRAKIDLSSFRVSMILDDTKENEPLPVVEEE